jgi:uncharacterized LabA/DUF88 family protein
MGSGVALRPLRFFRDNMNTIVYIDGFNLYYGSLRNTPYRWLNPVVLCHNMLPKDNIVRIRYFTSLVTSGPRDPDQLRRQRVYLRALYTLPIVAIHYGSFLANVVRKPLADGSGYADVLIVSEKGSDVNLASHMINDAHNGEFDIAVVITNDTDLREPLRIVRQELGKTVGILNPQKVMNQKLSELANFKKQIRPGVLAKSQFPDLMHDLKGIFHKPASW